MARNPIYWFNSGLGDFLAKNSDGSTGGFQWHLLLWNSHLLLYFSHRLLELTILASYCYGKSTEKKFKPIVIEQ